MLPRELELLRDCCRWSFAGGSPEPATDPGDGIHWPLVLQLARRHRVQALAWDSLSRLDIAVPQAVAMAFAADAAETAAYNLATTAECAGLAAAFAEAGLPILFLKGLTLAALAYPRPLLKMGWDIDVIVEPERLRDSAAVLRERGWVPRLPAEPSPAALCEWHDRRKVSVWELPAARLHLELHSRLADNRRLIPALDVHSPSQSVEIAPGVALPTLQDNALFAYLCVHGASSNWFRLKWATDLAAWLHRKSEEEIARLWQRSQVLGAGRTAGQALLVAHALYGTAGGTGLAEQLRSDPWTRWLARSAISEIAKPSEPTSRRLGTARIHLVQFALLPGLRFKFSELARQLSDLFS